MMKERLQEKATLATLERYDAVLDVIETKMVFFSEKEYPLGVIDELRMRLERGYEELEGMVPYLDKDVLRGCLNRKEKLIVKLELSEIKLKEKARNDQFNKVGKWTFIGLSSLVVGCGYLLIRQMS